MNLDPNAFVTAITALIVGLFFTLYTSSVHRLSFTQCDFQNSIRFVVHKLFYIIILVNLSFGICFFLIPYQSGNNETLAWVIFGFMGFIWILFNLRLMYQALSGHVVIDSEAVEMKYGKKVKRIPFTEIRDVDSVSFYIWVSTDNLKPALKIPMIFKGSHQILSILRSKINWSAKRDQSNVP